MNWEVNNMVELKTLGEITTIIRGNRVTKADLVENGEFPVISGGINPLGYIDKTNREPNTITIAQYGTAGYINIQRTKFWANDVCYSVYPKEGVHNEYLYYALMNVQDYIYSLKTNAVPAHLPLASLQDVQIPIPSKSEQERIVSILDTFTSSISNLKEQIKERRKQYEYYRDQLLDLEGKDGVEMKTLGEIFSFKNGLNKGKDYFGKGKLIIMFSNVFNSRYIDSTMLKNRVDINNNELERINANKGDVFFTRTSETKEDVGYASVLLEDIKECTFAGFLIRARPILNVFIPEYCKYCFSTQKVRESIVCRSSFTTRASLTGNGLGKVEIPIPPKQTQSRIVTILDQFEASIANLEAQLKEREKQYEYYRNQLLTFE